MPDMAYGRDDGLFCSVVAKRQYMSNRHWTDEEIEEAYRYWAWDSQDSLKATADYCAIPERTVRNWADRDDWRGRKKAQQAELAEPAVGEAQVLLKLGLSKVTEQLIADATNPKADHRDRLESQKLIYAMTLGTSYDIGKSGNFISLTDARQIHLSGLPNDPASLRRLASQAIEANVSSVDSGTAKRNGPIKHS